MESYIKIPLFRFVKQPIARMNSIRKLGFDALTEKLGLIGMIKFVRQFDSRRGVHTPPFKALKKSMYPESNTFREQHTPSLQAKLDPQYFVKML